MKQFNLCAAVAVMLCVAPLAVSYAQSNNEVFSPSGTYLTFDDGKQPTTGSFGGLRYEVISGHAVTEGDMVLGRVDGHGNLINNILGSGDSRGLGTSSLFNRWKNGVIPYEYGDTLSDEERSLAEQAIEHWNFNTTILLVEITDENRSEYENYLVFDPSGGCSSYVGMTGGRQELWVSVGCGVGSIIHEIGHAVGLFHEHTRSDRDNFITVHYDNIPQNRELNFDIVEVGAQDLGQYDYSSIMHYGNRFFSENNEDTITVKDGVSEIGQRNALSERDIQSVNKLYETDLSLVVNSGSVTEDNELVTEINVTNQGELGANGLTLSIQLNDGGIWRATSQNPGWDCVPDGALLNCERDTLEATATSLFSVVAEIPSGSSSSSVVELASNTFDTDLSNNGHNTTVSEQSGNANNEDETGDNTENNDEGFENPTIDEVETEDLEIVTNTSDAVSETDANGGTIAGFITDSEDIQQSSQPIVSAVDANNSENPAELGAALPEEQIDVSAQADSESGGSVSPLGGVALFLLTFAASIRRFKHG